jgi:Ca2+-binding EF-hand superfamily protein
MRIRSFGPALLPLVLSAAACQGPASEPAAPVAKTPAEDPAVALRRHHDEWWSWLATTYDKDGDGRIEPAEYGREPATFARLDRDGDGVVTRVDFERDLVLPADLVLPMLLVSVSGEREAGSVEIERASAAMARLDANGDGRIDRREFEAVVPAFMAGVDTFGTFVAGMDEDRDGLLSLPEIERWMKRRDSDHDGRLALRERLTEGAPPMEGFIRWRDREPAPPFTAAALAGGAPVTFASLVGEKPVALIFGSFT